MTVVSALITRHCTAHASDSFLTILKSDGNREVVEDQKPKVVPVKHWRGVLTYWGLAQFGQWSTLEWLRGRVQLASQFSSAEDFANTLSVDLNGELSRLPLTKPVDRGIGIHFTTYERMNDYWIPELFLISNWAGIPYTNIRSTGVGATRETYHTLNNVPSSAEHRDFDFRFKVHQALQSGIMFRYNNGDPALFNPVADAILDRFIELARRGVLNDPSSERDSLCSRPSTDRGCLQNAHRLRQKGDAIDWGQAPRSLRFAYRALLVKHGGFLVLTAVGSLSAQVHTFRRTEPAVSDDVSDEERGTYLLAGHRSSIAFMISSAHRTASAMALIVAGTLFPPSNCASLRAARILAAINSTRLRPRPSRRSLSFSLFVRL